jgi:hypothetical protein
VVCEGEECLHHFSDDEPTPRNRLTDFLLELVACGVRNLFLLCFGSCRGVCADVGSQSSPSCPALSQEWSYSDSNKGRLSSCLSFHSIASSEELERDVSGALHEIFLFYQRELRGTEDCPVLLTTVRHSQEPAVVSSSQAVYQMLTATCLSSDQRAGEIPRDGLTVSAQILNLSDPEADRAAFLSAIGRWC